uniref:SUN domain-containing protein n=1 Tax=Rhabditophanes sp. KR3021 TaxID=114890 RepID=A0AC35TXQ7_9BILA
MKHHLKSDSHNVIKISTGILRYQGSTLKTCALSDEVSTFYHEINTIDFEFKSSGPCFESVVKVSKVGGPEKLWNDFTRFVRDNFEIITHILLIMIISVCIIALVYIIIKLTYAKADEKDGNSEEPIYSPFKLTKKKDHAKFISISEVDMEHLTRSNSNDLNASAVIPIIYQNMIKDSEKWDHPQSMYHENMTYYNEESFQHSQTNSFVQPNWKRNADGKAVYLPNYFVQFFDYGKLNSCTPNYSRSPIWSPSGPPFRKNYKRQSKTILCIPMAYRLRFTTCGKYHLNDKISEDDDDKGPLELVDSPHAPEWFISNHEDDDEIIASVTPDPRKRFRLLKDVISIFYTNLSRFFYVHK